MNAYDLLTPKKSEVVALAQSLEAQKEKARMDFLSNPKNPFSYSVKSDGRVTVTKPLTLVATSLRAAVDYVIENESKWRNK